MNSLGNRSWEVSDEELRNIADALHLSVSALQQASDAFSELASHGSIFVLPQREQSVRVSRENHIKIQKYKAQIEGVETRLLRDANRKLLEPEKRAPPPDREKQLREELERALRMEDAHDAAQWEHELDKELQRKRAFAPLPDFFKKKPEPPKAPPTPQQVRKLIEARVRLEASRSAAEKRKPYPFDNGLRECEPPPKKQLPSTLEAILESYG